MLLRIPNEKKKLLSGICNERFVVVKNIRYEIYSCFGISNIKFIVVIVILKI